MAHDLLNHSRDFAEYPREHSPGNFSFRFAMQRDNGIKLFFGIYFESLRISFSLSFRLISLAVLYSRFVPIPQLYS